MQLIEEEHMLKWEEKIIVSKRRVLINYLVAKATEKVAKRMK